MKKIRFNKRDASKYPKWPVSYGSLKVMVPYPMNPREGKCDACGRSIERGDIKVTHLHHWAYKYKHATVKKDPLLALENLSELCYSCHRLGDAFRDLLFLKDDKLMIVIATGLLMPDNKDGRGKSMKDKMDYVARAWISARKTDRKTRMDQYT